MNLTDFRRAVKIAQAANVPLELGPAEAVWLLEGVEKDIALLTREVYADKLCPWCNGSNWFYTAFSSRKLDSIMAHAPDCPRQLALAHWSEP